MVTARIAGKGRIGFQRERNCRFRSLGLQSKNVAMKMNLRTKAPFEPAPHLYFTCSLQAGPIRYHGQIIEIRTELSAGVTSR